MLDSEFSSLIEVMKTGSPDQMAEGAGQLHSKSSQEDIPKLIEMLSYPDFFIREAASWPLSDMGVVEALPELLVALQRGFEEGHDNDGLQCAISDMAILNKEKTKAKLQQMRVGSDKSMLENIDWLLEYCE